MSSIIEDELNMVFDFANGTPSIEQVNEYTEWKLFNRVRLLDIIKDMDRDDRMQVCYDYYVTTIEFAECKSITLDIDQMLINQHTVFLNEFKYIFGMSHSADNPAYLLYRETKLHDLYNSKLTDIRDYIMYVMGSRMPIHTDIRWMISAPDLKQSILKKIPK